MDDEMDQYSQLPKEFDRLGLTDLFEGISVAGDRFYVVERLFASGKVSQEYRGLLRLLYLGESVAQSDLKPFIELIQLLADAGIVITEDGIVNSTGLVLNRYRGVWIVADAPRSNPKRYFGPDSLGLARRLSPRPGKRGLDLCAGSGIQSLIMAAGGMLVTSVEISAEACATNVLNSRLNGLDGAIQTVQGNLYEKLEPDGKYDYIVANPPLVPIPNGLEYPFVGDGGFDGCRVSNEIVEKLPVYLSDDGTALMVGMMACADGDSLDAVSLVRVIMNSELSGTMTLLGYDEVYPCSSFVEGVAWSAYLANPTRWTSVDEAIDDVYELYRNDHTVGVYYYVLRLRKGSPQDQGLMIIDNSNKKPCSEAWLI